MNTDNISGNPIIIRTIQPDDLENVINALNDSFSHYNVPLAFGGGKLEEMIYIFDIELECSIISLENGKITGVVLAGRRGDIAHIGPMGVIQKRQGAGLGKRLLEYALKHLEGMGAKKVTLEVIADNHRARRLYEGCGFLKTRVLRCYRAKRRDVENCPFRKVGIPPSVRMKSGGREVQVTFPEDNSYFCKPDEDKVGTSNINRMSAKSPHGRIWRTGSIDADLLFRWGTAHPGSRPWQRDYDSVSKQREKLRCFAAFDDNDMPDDNDNVLTYVLSSDYGIVDMGIYPDNFERYFSANFGIDEENYEMGDIEGIKEMVLKSIYMELILKAGGAQPMLAFKNVTPEEDFTRFAVSFGFENYLNQFEMEFVF